MLEIPSNISLYTSTDANAPRVNVTVTLPNISIANAEQIRDILLHNIQNVSIDFHNSTNVFREETMCIEDVYHKLPTYTSVDDIVNDLSKVIAIINNTRQFAIRARSSGHIGFDIIKHVDFIRDNNYRAVSINNKSISLGTIIKDNNNKFCQFDTTNIIARNDNELQLFVPPTCDVLVPELGEMFINMYRFIFPDNDLYEYLRTIKYMLTHNYCSKMFIISGPGYPTGKSTFTDVISSIFGKYGISNATGIERDKLCAIYEGSNTSYKFINKMDNVLITVNENSRCSIYSKIYREVSNRTIINIQSNAYFSKEAFDNKLNELGITIEDRISNSHRYQMFIYSLYDAIMKLDMNDYDPVHESHIKNIWRMYHSDMYRLNRIIISSSKHIRDKQWKEYFNIPTYKRTGADEEKCNTISIHDIFIHIEDKHDNAHKYTYDYVSQKCHEMFDVNDESIIINDAHMFADKWIDYM